MTDTDFEKVQSRLIADRKVRALAQAGSYGSDDAWAGSQPTLVTFERSLEVAQADQRSGVLVQRFPYEALERWREWEMARAEAPLSLLATSRVIYDPTSNYSKIQRTLWNLSPEKLAEYRQHLLQHAAERLEALAQQQPTLAEQLGTLVQVRLLAVEALYPALLTHLHRWPEFEIRLPHAWRAVAGLPFPKAIYTLDALYGFGGEAEARRVLSATRGMKLTESEKRARAAFLHGYYDGAVRLLRDDAAHVHAADLGKWVHLSSARQDKLSVLLGLERSPLGPAALAMGHDLLRQVRDGV